MQNWLNTTTLHRTATQKTVNTVFVIIWKCLSICAQFCSGSKECHKYLLLCYVLNKGAFVMLQYIEHTCKQHPCYHHCASRVWLLHPSSCRFSICFALEGNTGEYRLSL